MKIYKQSIKNIAGIKIILAALLSMSCLCVKAQINTQQVLNIGRNALYFEDYVLSIQYFNQVIAVKPYLADPYFYRAVAKINLDDYKGAEEDCTLAIERNPFIVDAYQIRGIARQTLKRNKEAINDYETGLKQMPEHKVFLMNKAVCEVAIKDYKAAEKTYSKLISIYPNYDNAYLGRAQLLIAKGDTAKSLQDVDKCIELNKNNSNAYVMRAEIKMRQDKDYKSALADMNEAIVLEPHYAGYFINRAFMKYNLDDYFGAMSDYDYAMSLDPTNVTAHYNRALLRAEVSENNKAIQDFSYVINSDPENVLAIYNRASLYYKTGQYKHAIADYNKVLQKYPNLQIALYARSECKRLSGDMAGGERDYNRSRALYKSRKKTVGTGTGTEAEEQKSDDEEFESEAAIKNKFNTLLTVDNDNGVKPEYDNKARGRIQNSNVRIDAEPMFVLSYYTQGGKIRETTNYMKEINDANATRMLQFVLLLSNTQPRLYEDQIQKHFNSIEYYNGVLATSQPRSIDYLGRAMDFIMVKNPQEAIADLNRAIALSPKLMLAYFARANAKYMQLMISQSDVDGTAPATAQDAMLKTRMEAHGTEDIMADYDEVLKLSPKNEYAYYNKGCLYLKLGNLTSAVSCFTEAVTVNPGFGEAYYNRGLAYLKLGNKERGIDDLSKAGELGILPSYNVLKRMSN